MNVGISFTFCSFFFILLLTIVFFSKKRFNSIENKLYSYLILTSLFGTAIGVPCYYFMENMDSFFTLNFIFSKLYLIYLVLWLTLFTSYIFYISVKRSNKLKLVKIMIGVSLLLTILVIILPLYYNNKNNIIYSYGPSTNLMYLVSSLFVIIIIICLIKNIKYVTQKKFIPIIVFLVFGTVIMIIQKLNPGLLLLTFGEAFITFLMYFTIENPDLQMINELYKNKRLVEESYEDKSNFLFEMTAEVREPLFNINNIYNEIKDEGDIKVIKDGLRLINSSIRQLDFAVNDVLDISTIDKEKIKFVNTRYNINNLYNDVIARMNGCIPKDVEFRHKISNNVPYLYGDMLKLKQIIVSILMNSVKKTKKGFIELNINSIEKYDVCRLIITIADSGGGISIDKVNDILKTTSELSVEDIKEMDKMEINLHLCGKIIKLLGGNLMIKNNDSSGSKVILTLDQRVCVDYKSKSTLLSNYEYYINSSKQILVVSKNKELIDKIKKRLKNENITITQSLYGMDAISKIKYGKKYNLILMDDELKELSGYSTFKELQKIDKFNIPTIIMLKKSKEHIKEEYINDGFVDYILLDDFSNEIEKVIYKY